MGINAYDVVKGQPNTFYICIVPIIYCIFSIYIWFSPISFGSNYLITHTFNTFNVLLETWIRKIEQIPDIESNLKSGFELMDTVQHLEAGFGKLLCIEFFESYSCLVFSTFFGSSALYGVLRNLESQHYR